MLKLFLTLFSKSFNEKQSICLSLERPQESCNNQFFRSSPLYQIDPQNSFISITKEFTGQIIFLYTTQPLELLDSIKKDKRISQTDFKIYLSHGFASLIMFLPNNKFGEEFDFKHLAYLVGHEIWEVKANEISKTTNYFPNFEFEPYVSLDFKSLGHEEQFIFSDIISSLNLAYSFSHALLKLYLPILDEIKRKIFDFYYRCLFLDHKISSKFFENKIKQVNIKDSEYVDELLKSYKEYAKNPNSIEQVYIKDEIIQIASALKNSNAQLFGCIPVFKYGTYQSGKNSLLGIGNNVLGFLSIYLHLRKCFNKFNFECVFEEKYPTLPSPQFHLKPDDDSYAKWYRSLIRVPELDVYLEDNFKETTHLIVYFSNRQGFRLTRHSVSAAMQSLYLSFLPSFTLNTLTHELLHAHVRSEIMVEFYPLIEQNNGYCFTKDIVAKYKKVFTSSHENYTIKDFLQISFLLMVEKLKSNLKNSETSIVVRWSNDENLLFESLKRWYKEIEEIIVHILDLHYFYNSKGSFYIKAIWTSWLALPFSINNLQDYILRTICAISSLDESTDRIGKFDQAVRLLKTELNELKNINLINKKYVNIVLDCLKNEDILSNLRFYYSNALVDLVDISKKFFFSSKLKTLLNYDSELIESTIENEFTYDLAIGKYINRTIESPIALINEINNINITNIGELNKLDKNEIEQHSAWLNSLIVTSLKKYTYEES